MLRLLQHLFICKDFTFWMIDTDEEGLTTFRLTGYSGTQCTGFAAQIYWYLPNITKIYGISKQTSPEAKVFALADGHDFTIIDDRYLVDPWIAEVSCGNMTTHTGKNLHINQVVFDMQNDEDWKNVQDIYGNCKNWERMTEVEKTVRKLS